MVRYLICHCERLYGHVFVGSVETVRSGRRVPAVFPLSLRWAGDGALFGERCHDLAAMTNQHPCGREVRELP